MCITEETLSVYSEYVTIKVVYGVNVYFMFDNTPPLLMLENRR